MRGQMMRAARRNAVRGHSSGHRSSESSLGDAGSVAIALMLIFCAVVGLFIASAFGAVGWLVLFLLGLPLMAGGLVYLVQKSSSPEKIEQVQIDKIEMLQLPPVEPSTKPPVMQHLPPQQRPPTFLTPKQRQTQDEARLDYELAWRRDAQHRNPTVEEADRQRMMEIRQREKNEAVERNQQLYKSSTRWFADACKTEEELKELERQIKQGPSE